MRLRTRLLLFGLLLLFAIAATGVDLLVLYPNRINDGPGDRHLVEVPAGVGPKGLANRLHAAGVISSPGRFAVWLRITGAISRIKAGTFELSDRLSPAAVLEHLSGRGIDKGTKVVFPEGFTLTEMGAALEAVGILEASEFIAAATDPTLVKSLTVPGPTFEGYLFPDTYYFEPDTPPREIIVKMHQTFLDQLEVLGISRTPALKALVTLASIVQAETALEREMPVVAGVYINRRTSPDYASRRLQADPTVSYGCQPHIHPRAPSCATFKGVLGRRQLDDPQNPYNTYQHPGLPPGPICAPGRAALSAAHRPSEVPYLFFVASSKKDGSHVFSTTLAEHRAAVEAYRRR